MDYQPLIASWAQDESLRPWSLLLPEQLATGLSEQRYGDLPRWRAALDALFDD